ncbi:hypothetical protein SVIO_106290 [Streptomyces violaceusniger]|uniref:Uncharacterized protein n=1 Tax=Streptomyces violaceusniger TaxID=68280 RepID=A0A4D4LL33_STRVO|nr:hypothetical protein SVIO_106290 [Streptomyces violaceusniger]
MADPTRRAGHEDDVFSPRGGAPARYRVTDVVRGEEIRDFGGFFRVRLIVGALGARPGAGHHLGADAARTKVAQRQNVPEFMDGDAGRLVLLSIPGFEVDPAPAQAVEEGVGSGAVRGRVFLDPQRRRGVLLDELDAGDGLVPDVHRIPDRIRRGSGQKEIDRNNLRFGLRGVRRSTGTHHDSTGA